MPNQRPTYINQFDTLLQPLEIDNSPYASPSKVKLSKERVEKRIRTSAKKQRDVENEEEPEEYEDLEFYLEELKDKTSVIAIGKANLTERKATGIAVTNLGELIGFELIGDGNKRLTETWEDFKFPPSYPEISKLTLKI